MWDNSQQLFREILVAILAILIVRELPSVLARVWAARATVRAGMSVAIRPTLGPVTAVLLLAGLLLVTVDGAPRFPPADGPPWTFKDVIAAFGDLGLQPGDSGYDVNQDGDVDLYNVIQISEGSRPLATLDGAPRFPPADDLPWTYADVDAAFGQLGQDPVVPTGYDVNQNGVVDFYDVIQIFERSRP